MKTTIEVEDAIFRQAKAVAVAQGVSLKEIINGSLRLYLDRVHNRKPVGEVKLHTVKGEGPALENDWGGIRSIIYEGQGE